MIKGGAVKLAAGMKEIIQEKGLSEDLILDVVKEVLSQAYKEYFGAEKISLEMDIYSNTFEVFIPKKIVKRVRDPRTQISSKQAMDLLKTKEIDESLTEIAVAFNPMQDFSPTEIMKISDSILYKIKNIEKHSLRDEFYKKKGKLASGTVIKITEEGDIFVDLGKTIGIIPLLEQSPLEHYENGDNIKSVVVGIDNHSKSDSTRKKNRKAEVILSRKSPALIKELLFIEIPEIADGNIEIKGISRLAGYKSKVLIETHANINGVAACIGPHGIRITSIIKEIGGEKIDIIEYNSNIRELVKSALVPAKVDRVVLAKDDEEQDIIYAVVAQDQLAYAFGKQKQNVILVSKLLSKKIQIQTDEEMVEKNIQEEYVQEIHDIFGTTLDKLDLEEELVKKLQQNNVASVEQLVQIHLNHQYKTLTYLTEEEKQIIQKSIKENVEISQEPSDEEDLIEAHGTPLSVLEDLSPWINVLQKNHITTIEQLVEAHNEEFAGVIELSKEDKNKIYTIIIDNIEIED